MPALGTQAHVFLFVFAPEAGAGDGGGFSFPMALILTLTVWTEGEIGKTNKQSGVGGTPGFPSCRHAGKLLGSMSLQRPVMVSPGTVFLTQKALTCL